RECFEMSLGARNLRSLFAPQIIGKETTLGFDHEVETLGPILFNHHGPVRVVVAKRRRYTEPTWQFCIHLYSDVVLKVSGEVFLCLRTVHNLLMCGFRSVEHVA